MKQSFILPFEERSIDIETFIANVQDYRPVSPFSEPVINALTDFTKRLRGVPSFANDPAWLALAFWFRKKTLYKLKEDFLGGLPSDTIPAPRGIAFHLPPQNVDTLFIYSWALSLLAGNINICRLPTDISPMIANAVRLLSLTLSDHNLKQSNLFVSFPHTSSAMKQISGISDVRLVWGGDAKISAVSKVMTKPRCITLNFADRFSFSLIKASSYLMMTADEKRKVAKGAYNDMYLFDQKACSSSRLYYFCGEKDKSAAAQQAFFEELLLEVKLRQYYVAGHTNISKFSAANRSAVDFVTNSISRANDSLTIVNLKELSNIRDENPGGGFAFSYASEGLDDLVNFVNSKDQTLAYLGLSEYEKMSLVERVSLKGIDRIVPIGEALNFDSVWDGFNLISATTKLIRVL